MSVSLVPYLTVAGVFLPYLPQFVPQASDGGVRRVHYGQTVGGQKRQGSNKGIRPKN